MFSRGGLGNLALILTHHPPRCSVAALMPLPCYHRRYSSRVAGPSAERGHTMISVHILWAFNLAQIQTTTSSGEKCTDRERVHANISPSWGSTACRCSWGASEEEITSASGTTAGLCSSSSSSTARWNDSPSERKSSGRPCSTSCHCVTLTTVSSAREARW